MAGRALTPCTYIGCGVLVRGGGRCPDHAHVEKRIADKQRKRGSRHERGYTNKWYKARDAYLLRNPLCRHCLERCMATPATVVDHIIDHKGNTQLFWDTANWQPLCKACHDRKTWTENRGPGGWLGGGAH